MMTLDLTKYGDQFTKSNINEELYAIGATSSDIDRVKIVKHAIIPERAFTNFPNLEIVENLRYCDSIGGAAFEDCSKLANDKLDNCSYIGSMAFNYCQLIDFKDLSCAQHIESDAFAYSGLNGDIKVSDVSGQGAFAATRIETVTIPKNSTIRNSCFYNCEILNTVYNLRYASEIGNQAFYKCTSLGDITLDNCKLHEEVFSYSGVTSVNIAKLLIDRNSDNGIRAFQYCRNLRYVEIGDTSKIPTECFLNDTALETVRIPKKTSIEESAFSGCSGLKIVYNLAYITYIGSSAFSNCALLENDKLGLGGTTSIYQYAFSGSGKEFKDFTHFNYADDISFRGSNITEAICNDVGPGWFEDCGRLRQVTVNKNAKLGDTCFYACENLQTINNLRYCSYIGNNFLRSAGERLTHNTINLTIENISQYAFGRCEKLEWNLPNITISELTNKNYCGAFEGTVFHCSDGNVTVPEYD